MDTTIIINSKGARKQLSVAVATVLMIAWVTGADAFVNGPLGNNNNNGITVPDPNILGLLDQSANQPAGVGALWPKITNAGNKTAIQQLGKALFWDMQVGGDGVQSCASCHFHAGADHRKTNQVSPGLKAGDNVHSQVMPGPNGTLEVTDYGFISPNQQGAGLSVNEAALTGAIADDLDGASHIPVLLDPISDVNDVVSSQGIRFGQFVSLNPITADSYGSVDNADLASHDDGFNGLTINTNDGVGFNKTLGAFSTVRRVEPRNTPTVINAVYNFRNFWDGRADAFFNGRNPLGFRDPNARVPSYDSNSGTLVFEHLAVPFSSLASQAVGPVLSQFEMHWDPRNFADVGQKLAYAKPLDGQAVAANDSLLETIRDSGGRGLNGNYRTMIRAVFDRRFVGVANSDDEVCLDFNPDNSEVTLLGTYSGNCRDAAAGFSVSPGHKIYSLLEWNMPLFFGLSVQTYEATLTTPYTAYDLIESGLAKGTITNRTIPRPITVEVGPATINGRPRPALTLDECILAVAGGNNAVQQGVAATLCTAHYAKFIQPGAIAGAEAPNTAFPVAAGAQIGGCLNIALNGNISIPGCATNTVSSTTATAPLQGVTGLSPNNTTASNSLLAINRGLNRFLAGNTACGVCHFNPEFTGATVSALTGFGKGPAINEPPGQLRKAGPERPMERMVSFTGAIKVYDSGFYNLGIRPSPEDISIGDQIGGVPLAFTKLAQILNGRNDTSGDAANIGAYDIGKINLIRQELDPVTGILKIPLFPNNLTPQPWTLALACGPGLVGNGNANNNPAAQCIPNVQPTDLLLRNGAHKASGLRIAKFTGPYFHNGSKMNLRQVFDFYQNAGDPAGNPAGFTLLNLNNLDAGLRIINLAPQEEAAVIEFMETGLTDWRVAYERGAFDHPEICVPNGHDVTSGKTILAGVPAVGQGGGSMIQTFQEQLAQGGGFGLCTVKHQVDHDGDTATPSIAEDISTNGFSDIDTP